MSWHFLQEQEEASWEESSLDGAPFALLNLLPTHEGSYSHGSETESLTHSQSGTTCAHSTESHGVGASMSLAEDFHAKTLAPQERAQALMEPEAGCGARWHESFATFNPLTSSWKIRQTWLFEGLDESLETWPRWGIMQNGACSEPLTAGLPIIERGFGFVPTPLAQDGSHAGSLDRTKGGRFWNLRDWYHVTMGKKSGKPARKRKRAFWEWLMGWPENWTALSALETAKFQQWLDSHGKL